MKNNIFFCSFVRSLASFDCRSRFEIQTLVCFFFSKNKKVNTFNTKMRI